MLNLHTQNTWKFIFAFYVLWVDENAGSNKTRGYPIGTFSVMMDDGQIQITRLDTDLVMPCPFVELDQNGLR